ncbi:MAG: hypothetical protein WB952_14945 [Terriglobales bacterium]
MTIIAGFKSYEGIVLCADTQETLEHAKRNIPKLRFEPLNTHGFPVQENVEDLAVAFCGAGDGPFIDKLVSEAWQDASVATSLDEACVTIEASIKRTYKEFGSIYQAGMCPEVQLIFGVKMDHRSRLFSAMGPIVNEKRGYDCGGVGHYMADFLASRMYGDYLPVHMCVILAAYVLFQSKEHVDGCGGDSQIVVLREDGSSGLVDWKRLEAITELLSRSDHDLSELLLKSANLNIADKELKEAASFMYDLMETFRSNQRDELRKWDDMTSSMLGEYATPTDALGLPAPQSNNKIPDQEE